MLGATGGAGAAHIVALGPVAVEQAVGEAVPEAVEGVADAREWDAAAGPRPIRKGPKSRAS